MTQTTGARHNRMICTPTTQRSMRPPQANSRRSGAIWGLCRTNRRLRPVTAAQAALLRPATRPPHLGSRPGPEPGLSFGLIHLRTGPFTGGHPDRVRAARGRWRTPVNSMQHCWKACWGQPLRSSNLLSSATADLRRRGQIMVGAALPPTACVSFSVSV